MHTLSCWDESSFNIYKWLGITRTYKNILLVSWRNLGSYRHETGTSVLDQDRNPSAPVVLVLPQHSSSSSWLQEKSCVATQPAEKQNCPRYARKGLRDLPPWIVHHTSDRTSPFPEARVPQSAPQQLEKTAVKTKQAQNLARRHNAEAEWLGKGWQIKMEGAVLLLNKIQSESPAGLPLEWVSGDTAFVCGDAETFWDFPPLTSCTKCLWVSGEGVGKWATRKRKQEWV